jgi:phytoene dehydrogenase-like protein
LPAQIIKDLELEVQLAPRRFGSFTPSATADQGLLIDKDDASATERSFADVDAAEDFERWDEFYAKTEVIAQKLFGTVLEPLRREHEVAELLGPELWRDFFERTIGETIENTFASDLVRGVVMTDALIGTFAPNNDPNLDANKCFLYHVIGNETGEWSIPVGGMGAVSSSMAKRAKELGAELKANCEVLAISDNRVVTYLEAGQLKTLHARYILANVSEPVLNSMLGKPTEHNIEGAQVKVNMLLKRLPRLKAGTDPVAAFGGTFHINESFEQLQTAFEQAENGEIPNPLPCEIYCHSLTDPSILGPELRASGAQTLTVFALHTPHSLLKGRNHDEMRAALELAAINSINSVLAEDIRDLLLIDSDGNPCIETKTTQDLEDALGLPGGNIFHAPLSWPYAENDEPLQTPAQQWGVDTGEPGILFCGSTAKRGGAVSGIAGHNAAMAVLKLEEERLAH